MVSVETSLRVCQKGSRETGQCLEGVQGSKCRFPKMGDSRAHLNAGRMISGEGEREGI